MTTDLQYNVISENSISSCITSCHELIHRDTLHGCSWTFPDQLHPIFICWHIICNVITKFVKFIRESSYQLAFTIRYVQKYWLLIITKIKTHAYIFKRYFKKNVWKKLSRVLGSSIWSVEQLEYHYYTLKRASYWFPPLSKHLRWNEPIALQGESTSGRIQTADPLDHEYVRVSTLSHSATLSPGIIIIIFRLNDVLLY